ncbi:hypothetical protein G6K86_29930 [Agrobacterium rhizogenes]|nr:hypothetical protein [Rhizobium rhizogenes]
MENFVVSYPDIQCERSAFGLFVTQAVFITALVFSPTIAAAWGCKAAATEGNATGESSGFKRIEKARAEAMRECSIRTDQICEIIECRDDHKSEMHSN